MAHLGLIEWPRHAEVSNKPLRVKTAVFFGEAIVILVQLVDKMIHHYVVIARRMFVVTGLSKRVVVLSILSAFGSHVKPS